MTLESHTMSLAGTGPIYFDKRWIDQATAIEIRKANPGRDIVGVHGDPREVVVDLEAAISEEREACAKIVDVEAESLNAAVLDCGCYVCIEDAAAAIRERGK